jgi:hypothetical protein
MSDELDLTGADEHETEGEKPKRPSRSKTTTTTSKTSKSGSGTKATEADLKRRIEDGLDELATFARKNHWSEVADAIKEDRTRMAEVLAYHAGKRERLAKLVLRVFGKGSLLAIARAFGPTLRTVGERFRNWRDRRADEADIVDGVGEEVSDVAAPGRYATP